MRASEDRRYHDVVDHRTDVIQDEIGRAVAVEAAPREPQSTFERRLPGLGHVVEQGEPALQQRMLGLRQLVEAGANSEASDAMRQAERGISELRERVDRAGDRGTARRDDGDRDEAGVEVVQRAASAA